VSWVSTCLIGWAGHSGALSFFYFSCCKSCYDLHNICGDATHTYKVIMFLFSLCSSHRISGLFVHGR